MNRLTLTLATLLLTTGAAHASGGALPYHFEPDTSNTAAIQRGARDFMAYCSGCHSLKHLRYNRLAKDTGIPEDLLKKYLMGPGEKPGDTILTALPHDDAKRWFGQAPPDLSLTSRRRTPSWVYSYFMTFYLDPAKANGVNNLVLPGVSMPHVLGDLQGWQVHKPEQATSEHGNGHHGPSVPLELAVKGSLTQEAYAKRVADLTTFMAYASEPGKQNRIALGKKVMVYLLILFVCAYLLKKEYWRDVH